MKKQIAVLMAAATAVTTVAPVIASADVNEHKDTAISTVVDKAKKALDEKYKDKKVDGLGNSYSNDVDEVLNSRYIVLVNKAGQGFKAVKDSVYKGKKFSFVYPCQRLQPWHQNPLLSFPNFAALSTTYQFAEVSSILLLSYTKENFLPLYTLSFTALKP